MQGRGKVMLALGPRVLPLAIAMSSKPITDSCSGTRNPQSHAARRQRNAMRSLEQMTAVAAAPFGRCRHARATEAAVKTRTTDGSPCGAAASTTMLAAPYFIAKDSIPGRTSATAELS